jgi:hypothetical protein
MEKKSVLAFVRQMRANCARDGANNVIVSPALWEKIARTLEGLCAPACAEWLDPAWELPTDDSAVLAVVWGRVGKVKYHGAVELACYFEDEDVWALWQDPNREIRVSHWMPIPEVPTVKEGEK